MHQDTVRIQAERSAKRFWVSLVVGLLGLQLTIGYVAIRLAGSDPSVAIVPDYHQAALQWDEYRSAISAPERLGLLTDLDVSRVANTDGTRAIVLEITDTNGTGLANVQATATIYRHSRAGDVQTLAMNPIGDGKFMTDAIMPQAGLWQVNVAVAGAPEPIQVVREFTF